MQVVFVKTVNKIGQRGEVKNVADGYALNYLIPNKIALPATAKNIQAIKDEQARAQKGKAPKLPAEELARRLRGVVLNFSGKVDDQGTLFAGITRDKLAEGLTKSGFAVAGKQINLEAPIKKPGEYKVGVTVAPNVKSEFKVVVTNL